MLTNDVKARYLNWLSLIETDYITMFIKTWFTFLASLQEITENTSTNERGIGDSQILEEYKSKIFDTISIRIDEEFVKNIFRAYIQAKNNCLNSDNFLRDYFNIFYKYNENFLQEFTYTYRGKTTKLSLEIHLNGEEKNLKIVLTDDRKKFKDYFGNNIETGFSLSEEVERSKIFEEKRLFIRELLDTIRRKAENVVNSNSNLDERGRQRRFNFLNDECLKDVERKIDNEFNLPSLFPLKPDNAISNLNPTTLELQIKPQYFDENLTKWFVDFSYKLRNILFHFIIDPMDRDWQLLFKYAYLSLKHLTEENIRILQNRGVENENSNS